MVEIVGHNIAELPFYNLKKVSDLLFYEGPILSHFIDSKGNNYLFYWVDFDSHYNRWLIWKITEYQIYKYIKGEISLNTLLLEKNKDYLFSVDIDNNLNYSNIKILDFDEIPQVYIPEENTYFDVRLTPSYEYYLEKFEENAYLSILRDNSVQFILSPRDNKYSSTVSIDDVSSFFKKLSISFNSFLEFDFFETFKNTISDVKRLNKILNKFKDVLAPRIVDLEYSSFMVAISTDTIKIVESGKFKPWQRSVLNKYKSEVVEIDYNSEKTIKDLNFKYPSEFIKAVHLPIIDIINDKKYQLTINDFKNRYKKTYRGEIPQKNIKMLLPSVVPELEQIEKKRLVNVLFELSENDDLKNIRKKDLQTGILFSQEVKKYKFPLERIEGKNIRITLKRPIFGEFFIENNLLNLSNVDFNIHVTSENPEEILLKFNSEFIKSYIEIIETPSEKRKEFQNHIISFIKIVESIE